jgi:hypothetical protein
MTSYDDKCTQGQKEEEEKKSKCKRSVREEKGLTYI